MLNAIGDAHVAGAENLLKKAVRSRASGDARRAERLIRPAARMPYDEREAGSPGVRAASMLVPGLISGQFEPSGFDDPAWLDAPLTVHGVLDSTGQAEVASVAHGFVLQQAFSTTSPVEKRRIRQAWPSRRTQEPACPETHLPQRSTQCAPGAGMLGFPRVSADSPPFRHGLLRRRS
jgi:hypothetical protein